MGEHISNKSNTCKAIGNKVHRADDRKVKKLYKVRVHKFNEITSRQLF